MRFGTWRGVTLGLSLAVGLFVVAGSSARAQVHTIPRLVPAVDVNTGGPYYAPPIPAGHYTGHDLAGKVGLIHGKLATLGSACPTCGGLGHNGAGGACPTCGGGLGHGGGSGSNGCATCGGGPVANGGSQAASTGGCGHNHGATGGNCGQALGTASTGGCGHNYGAAGGNCGTASGGGNNAGCGHNHGATSGGCNHGPGVTCPNCAQGHGLGALASAKGVVGHLLGHDKIKWFNGPGGPIPLTPGYTPYVNVTRSPRDFFAFPPFTPQ